MGRWFTPYRLIVYSGILALLSLIATVVLGITGASFNLHKTTGIITLLFALIHIFPTIYNRIKLIKKRRSK